MTQRVFEDDFRMLVGHYAHGTDPSLNNLAVGCPPKIRTTMTMGNAWVSGEPGLVGGVTAGYTTQLGEITVADNDFTTGRCVLALGSYELVFNLNVFPGAGVNDTATALAAAIALFPGFTATADAAVVTVGYVTDVNVVVPFEVRHYGSLTNLTLSPTTGALSHGTPGLGAPIIT